jgi:tyrosinase
MRVVVEDVPMPRTRQDVWKLGNDWHDTILWYARAVKDLSKRPFSDMTSWRYLAAMHGVSEQLWRHNGYLTRDENLPGAKDFQREDKDQCQHHTWYFLPWHRGYLRAFEKIIASSITKLGGPGDTWALPYWNYNDMQNPNRLKLPPAFGSPTWPDGGDNPLFIRARYGLTGKSGAPIVIDKDSVELETALIEREFAGATTGGSPGFGGGQTPFKHGAAGQSDEGLLEQSPHDNVHGDIGGAQNNDFRNALALGLMSNPSTAGLDPIFWLHHANIDRLWEVWLKRGGHTNPEDSPWRDGPTGARPFIMPEPDGSTRTRFFPREMLDTTSPKLDYTYEDTSDPFPGVERVARRMESLGLELPMTVGAAMTRKPKVELMGAEANALSLAGPDTEARVRLDGPTSRKMLESFQQDRLAAGVGGEPDRVFLNLENITGSSDAASFKIYVGLNQGDNPDDHPANMAGVVTLFGVSEASDASGSHAGNGLNKVVEITKAVDSLHLESATDLNELPIRFVLRRGQQSDIQIGRISIYRQGD